MKMTIELREQIIEIARPLLQTIFEDEINGNVFEGVEPTIEEIEHKAYSGFWPWTSGGVDLHGYQYVSHLVSTGYYNAQTKIGQAIYRLDNEAHAQAIAHVGERTEENEDRYFAVVDEWLSDATVDVGIQVKFYEPDDFGNPTNKDRCIMVDIFLECGGELVSDERIIHDLEKDLEGKLKLAIEAGVKFLNDNI